MEYKNGKWANKIIDLQQKNGSWGYFHSLSKPTKQQPMTTEQALRRLEILGYDLNDKPIQNALKYLNNCLKDHNNIPDHYEVGSDWRSYLDLMISTWIKRFDPDNNISNKIASKWVEIVNNSFIGNIFDQEKYNSMYNKIMKPEKGKRLWGVLNFYGVSILANSLDKNIEPIFFNHVLNFPTGIYYFGYHKPIVILPEVFQSKRTSDYLRMLELLTKYKNKKCREQLHFLKKWLKDNQINVNEWDLGKNAKDNILFPLSDSWRKVEDRIKDCTYFIKKIYGIM
jgi:hypothetical protein